MRLLKKLERISVKNKPMARLKVLFRIPFTIYYLALAIFDKKKLLCIATKEFDDDGKYRYYEISLTDNLEHQDEE